MKYNHILTTPTVLSGRWHLIALLLAIAGGCDIFSSGSSGENRREWSEPMVLFVDPDTVDSGPFDGIGSFKMDVHEGTIHSIMDRGRTIGDSLLDFNEIIFLQKEPGGEPQFRQLTPRDIPSERPIVLRDQSGSLHLMWADRRLDPGFDRWESPFTQISGFSTNVVYSQFNGTSFEPPVSIYEGNLSTFGMGDIGFPLHLIEAENRRLHAVFQADSAYRTTTVDGDSVTVFIPQVTYMNRSSTGQWSNPRFLVDPLRPVGTENDPVIAAPSANRLVVGFLSSAGGVNDVFTITSDDGGRTWNDQQLVFSSGQQASTMLRMMQAQGGQTHLVWGRAHRGLPLPGEMWHSYSEDGGTTWSTPEQFFKLESKPTLTGPDKPPVPIFRYIGSFDLLVDEQDWLHWAGTELRTNDDESRDSFIHYTAWDPSSKTWEPDTLLEFTADAGIMDLALDRATGKLYLFWEKNLEKTLLYSVK